MKKWIPVFLFFIWSLSVVSQEVTVNGKDPDRANKLVRVIVYSDQFSNLETTIAETKTNASGEFFMKFDIDDTKFAYLAVELEKGEFYLSPGAYYNFNIIQDTVLRNGSIFDKLPLKFILDAEDSGIYRTIGDFNIEYNEFIYNNIKSIYKSKDKSVITNFVSEMNEKYAADTPEYVSNYVRYSLASLIWLSRKEDNKQILYNYFIDQPVLYNNIQYTDFFKEFFKSYFDNEKMYSYEELILAINSSEPIEIIYGILARDEQLALDRRVSEIVGLLLLSRNYYNRDVEKERVISKLKDVQLYSNFPENQIIAKNFIIKLQELQNGSKAPYFALLNSDNDSISIDDLRGKFILLSFVKEDCSICDFQMQQLSDIKKQNEDRFEIVTVIAGNELKRLNNFARERGYQWPILKTGDNILLLEDYNIRAYPSYIFVNPDGTIAYAHLPMPEENMELYLQRFMDSYNAKKK